MKAEKLNRVLRGLDALAANPGTPEEGVAAREKAAALRNSHIPFEKRFEFDLDETGRKFEDLVREMYKNANRARDLSDILHAMSPDDYPDYVPISKIVNEP